MIKVEYLNKSYGDNKILKDLNFTVNKGEVVSIIGTSGTGKSTFLRCLNYLEKPDTGLITIGDVSLNVEDATKQDIEKLRLKSAMIFQNYNLFLNKTVMQNVTLPLISTKRYKKKEAEEIAIQVLNKVGMAHKVNSYPITLSGGEQQRVSIARAIAKNPKLLLCDEPTGALDYKTGKQILKLLQDLTRTTDTTVVLITHNSAIKNSADRLIEISDAKVKDVFVNDDPRDIMDIEW